MESSIKRRKIAAATLNINDLPVGFLINAASPICPSAVEGTLFFAVQWRCWDDVNRINYLEMKPSAITKAIVSSTQWETLDFEDIEKSLYQPSCRMLIYYCNFAMYQSNNLTKLKLVGCVKYFGVRFATIGRIKYHKIDRFQPRRELWEI